MRTYHVEGYACGRKGRQTVEGSVAETVRALGPASAEVLALLVHVRKNDWVRPSWENGWVWPRWLEEPTVTEAPEDQQMRATGAPRLPGMEE